MGGSVALALNLAVFPDCLPDELITAILRGAADKLREAGGAVAGGHTVEGPEPLFGMAVVGFAPRQRIWTKAGALPGDHLVLTKPLGTGIVTTASKADQAASEHVDETIRWMAMLNRRASELATGFAVHAATDITGFALLGHAVEMAHRSQAKLRFRATHLPFVAGAEGYAQQWLFPAGTNNNEAAFSQHVIFAPHMGDELRLLLFTPETSGGLLLSLTPEEAQAYLGAASEQGVAAWLVGEVAAGEGMVEVV